MKKVRLYSRRRCGLCDEARKVIEGVRTDREIRFDLEEVFIDGDDALEIEYGIRIPVVEVDGVEIAEVRLDPGEFAEALGLYAMDEDQVQRLGGLRVLIRYYPVYLPLVPVFLVLGYVLPMWFDLPVLRWICWGAALGVLSVALVVMLVARIWLGPRRRQPTR